MKFRWRKPSDKQVYLSWDNQMWGFVSIFFLSLFVNKIDIFQLTCHLLSFPDSQLPWTVSMLCEILGSVPGSLSFVEALIMTVLNLNWLTARTNCQKVFSQIDCVFFGYLKILIFVVVFVVDYCFSEIRILLNIFYIY